MRLLIGLAALFCICACTQTPVISDDAVSDRFPAGMPGVPMRLICAGPASADWVFGFYGVPGKMSVQYAGNGGSEEPIVAGVANITLRTRGTKAEFEKSVILRGSRSADGRTYHLAGAVDDQILEMELVYNGTGTLTRAWSDRHHRPEKYLSMCAENSNQAAN